MSSSSLINSYLLLIDVTKRPCGEAHTSIIVIEYKVFSVPDLETSDVCSVRMFCKYTPMTQTKQISSWEIYDLLSFYVCVCIT